MNTLEYVCGEVCKIILPIPEETRLGDSESSIAVCTLSSISLLREISDSDMLNDIAIVGRLFSENVGIDALVRFVNSNKNIKKIILCGKEVQGHRTGSSLLALYENGIDNNGRIISSDSPDPILQVSKNQVRRFRNQIRIINRIGETNPAVIRSLINSLKDQ